MVPLELLTISPKQTELLGPIRRKANFFHADSEVRYLLNELVSSGVKKITYVLSMETKQSHSLMPSCPHDDQCKYYYRSHNGSPSNEQ